ncbi:hypothetical protein ACFE04_028985 [Oxalis oulophora]
MAGINDKCTSQEVQPYLNTLRELSGVRGYCIEVGNGVWDSWFMPIDKQAKIVCRKVKKMRILKKGYNLVGLSQGNMIARGLIEFCKGPPVKNYISLAGPHAGVALGPLCKFGEICQIVDNLIQENVYSDYIQGHFAPSGYLKIPDDVFTYLRSCKYLPKLNNERPGKRKSMYKKRFTSLDNLVLIMFDHDEVIVPRESSWFGFHPDGSIGPVLPPQKTKLYKEDWIGLRTLDKKGKVKFIRVEGFHLKISIEDTKKYVVPYLEVYSAPVKQNNSGSTYNHNVSPNSP